MANAVTAISVKDGIDEAFILAENAMKNPWMKTSVHMVHQLVDTYLTANPSMQGLNVTDIIKKVFAAIEAKTSNPMLKMALGMVENIIETLVPATLPAPVVA